MFSSLVLPPFFFQIKNTNNPKVTTVNRDLSQAKHEAEAIAKQAKADTLKKIDEFDRTVEEKAAKSKSYLSSWFGSK